MQISRARLVLRILLPACLFSASCTIASLSGSASAALKINYVALGDSYSSGEGLAARASAYLSDPYNSGDDGCHRASDAYPELVKKSFGSSLGTFTFVACSGAYSGETMPVVADFDKGGSMLSGRDREAPQISSTYLTPLVSDISLTIGGNDAGFADVAKSCTSIMLKEVADQQVIGLPPALTGGSCASMLARSKSVIGNGTASSELGEGLVKTYEAILDDATNARLAVLTYPQLLTPKQIPASSFCPLTGGVFVPELMKTVYLGFNSKVQGDVDSMESGVNNDISSAVAVLAHTPQYQGRIRLVNVTASTAKYAQPCNTKTMGGSDINGIDFAAGDGLVQVLRCVTGSNASASCNNFIATKTLHPTEAGHQRMAAALESAFKANWESGSTTAKSIASDGSGYCEVLTSGGVDCWGYGVAGALGNGLSATSATPVPVVSTSGSGTLGGVVSLVGIEDLAGGYLSGTYCALLSSGDVDCWGGGTYGELGNGQFYTSDNPGSPVPEAVVSTSGTGTLSGVVSLTGGAGLNGASFCAVLTSGGVDCWGEGYDGDLGSGQIYDSSVVGSDIPVSVVGTSGSGTLTGVASVSAEGEGGYANYCAVLTSGGVDCWGNDSYGELGNGVVGPAILAGQPIPVSVVSTSGSGTLSGVVSLTGDGDDGGNSDYCAVLSSGGVDCWGSGNDGQLGNGQFYPSDDPSSAVPVSVVSTSGSGTLNSVASLTAGKDSFCARLTTGEVDCWGLGDQGGLGDGQSYASGDGSAVPVAVVSTSGSGTLGDVVSLVGGGSSNFDGSYCGVLSSGGVDCWGSGYYGELGNGQFSPSVDAGSDLPVAVVSTSGSGTLSGAVGISNGDWGSNYCALLTSGGLDCWGLGNVGQLGNGTIYSGFQDTAVPVIVTFPS